MPRRQPTRMCAHLCVGPALAACFLNNPSPIAPSILPDMEEHVQDSRNPPGFLEEVAGAQQPSRNMLGKKPPPPFPTRYTFSGEDSKALQEVIPLSPHSSSL